MPPKKNEIQATPFAEFQALPLEFLVGAPLMATVKSQALAADMTLKVVESLAKAPPIELSVTTTNADGTTKSTKVQAPVLTMVPVPHLRIDSCSLHLKFEIRQVTKALKEVSGSGELKVSAGALAKPFVDVSLSGSVSGKSTHESESERNGLVEISIQASEAEMPIGLRKIINALANTIGEGLVTDDGGAPAPAPAP